MGYCTIRLSPGIQETTTIVTKFGKCRYNSLPTVMCAPGDIFQSKVDELIGDTEDVKTYINDILVLSNECFGNHI